jgi:hypothetical protein
MFGFGMPNQMNMMNLAARMLAASGGGGQPGMGFGQGVGSAFLGAMTDAQRMGQLSYQNNMQKKRLELAEKEAERAERERERAAEDRRRAEEVATTRFVASMNAATERDRMARESAEKIASTRAEASPSTLKQIYELEQKAAEGDPYAQKALQRFGDLYSRNPYGGFGDFDFTGGTGGTGGTNPYDVVQDTLEGGTGGGSKQQPFEPMSEISPTTTPAPNLLQWYEEQKKRQQNPLWYMSGLPQTLNALRRGFGG